jgi:hypothetical protein
MVTAIGILGASIWYYTRPEPNPRPVVMNVYELAYEHGKQTGAEYSLPVHKLILDLVTIPSFMQKDDERFKDAIIVGLSDGARNLPKDCPSSSFALRAMAIQAATSGASE